MEELLEIIAWSQLGIHEKPVRSNWCLQILCIFFIDIFTIQNIHFDRCTVSFSHLYQVGLLNADGYYNGLLALFDKGVEEGFIKDTARDIVITAETAAELIEKMEVQKKTSPINFFYAPRSLIIVYIYYKIWPGLGFCVFYIVYALGQVAELLERMTGYSF